MIRFTNITITDAQRIDLTVDRDGTEDHLWFQFNQPVILTDDTIALALATLCGKAYKDVHLGLRPSPETVTHIGAFTSAQVTTNGTAFTPKPPRDGLALSFSGGFDSLAAYCLMPGSTQLVSMDYMGRFARERVFFEKFNPIIVQTNLLDTGLHNNSWAFMGIGAILTSQHTRAAYHTFGSILEAGPDNLSKAPAAARNQTFPPFAAAGFTNAPYVAGLTEIGTLRVLMHYKPEHIRESLPSVASPGEEKLYRKQVLTQVVAGRLGVKLDIDLTPKPARPHFAFGQNFALDLLSLYVAKYAGEGVANELVRDIPANALDVACKLELTFFERANTNLFQHFPAPLHGALVTKLTDAGIRFYTEQDWDDYREVRQLLGPYHPTALR